MAPRSVAIDIVEENIQNISPSLLRALLKDMTTGENIVWATDDYADTYGEHFERDRKITEKLVTGRYWNVIMPRTAKMKSMQDDRTKKRAEVFTPSWICNKQNNLIDERWFGRKDVFNEEKGQEWLVFHDKIEFPDGKTWQDYVDSRRMEVTCGEAPYLASRYDTTTGERIKLDRRIGLLDRKFRVIHENASSDEEWLKWAYRALQSVYGYEFQGDNVLLARENILFTFIDNYKYRFKTEPDIKTLLSAAKIIVWNIWQMDGRTYMPPYTINKSEIVDQPTLFSLLDEPQDSNSDVIKKPDKPPKEGSYCLVKNWRKSKNYKMTYKSLINGGKKK